MALLLAVLGMYRYTTPAISRDQPAVAVIEEAAAPEWPDVMTRADIDRALELAGWPRWLWDEAASIAWCESTWRRWAWNESGAAGLWQVTPLWFARAGLSYSDWADPVVNARAALNAYEYRGGWNEWVCNP